MSADRGDRRLPRRPGERASESVEANGHLGRRRHRHRVPLAEPPAGGSPRRTWLAAPTSTSSTGSRRRSAGCSARVTRSSCPSCSGRCTCRWCRSSPGAGPPSRRSRDQMQRAWLAFAGDGRPQPRRHRRLAPLGSGRARHHDLRCADRARGRRRGTRSWPSWSGIGRSSRACPADGSLEATGPSSRRCPTRSRMVSPGA